MEQHPVPQNVTTFQFRLIGDMTLKQFGYLAGGAVCAYLAYHLPFPNFITIPAAVGVFLFGFGLAFVPIEERPMDVWVLSFLKSVYSPTLYVWQREKPIPEPAPAAPSFPAAHPISPPPSSPPPPEAATPIAPVVNTNTGRIVEQTIRSVPHQQPSAPQLSVLPKPQPVSSIPLPRQGNAPQQVAPIVQTAHTALPKKNGFFVWLATLFSPKPKTAQISASSGAQPKIDVFANLSTPSVVGERLNLPPTVQTQKTQRVVAPPASDAQSQSHQSGVDEKTKELEQKLTSLQKELQNQSVSDARIIELQKQLTDVLSEKQRMESELATLRTKLTQAPAAAMRPATFATTQQNTGPTVKVITAETAIRAGLPRLTTFPNVVTGIIKDNDNNLLPAVLITIRDKEGVPLRALKTNKLGQFAASTPLPNGTYLIEVEDPRNRYVFDRAQISLSGSVVPAIEVVAKSQKELSRDKLAKELFNNQHM